MILSPAAKAFLAENAHRSPEELALLAGRYPDLPMPIIAQQVKGRAKIRSKLPSWHANPDVAFAHSLALEQCTSERVAEFRATLVEPGKRAIDLTGGFGVDARFLAERFEAYLYCERDSELASVVEANFGTFGLAEKVSCRIGDGLEILREQGEGFDLLYVDPARRDERSFKVSALQSCEPDLTLCWKELLQKASVVAVKLSPGLDVSSVLEELPGIESLFVVSVDNDCKELFALARSEFAGEARIHCVNLRKDGSADRLDFLRSEESLAPAHCSPPGKFLCEPNASIMKAGAFKTVSKNWGLDALNPRTRLYGADAVPVEFQGRVFEILDQGPIGSKEAKRLFPKRKAHVISRNSGMSAEELRKKLGLKEGGELFAIGAAVSGLGRRLYACRLVQR